MAAPCMSGPSVQKSGCGNRIAKTEAQGVAGALRIRLVKYKLVRRPRRLSALA
jgi:hypothetical protein